MSAVYDAHITKIMDFFKLIETTTKIHPGEFLFILSFVVNFIIGRIIHFAAPEEEVYNYYTNKRNVFNQVFVKRGWGWTTLVMVLFYSNVIYRARTGSSRIAVARKAAVHYVLATTWWVLFTQWCFGMPIMDKIFIWTGGKCRLDGTASVSTEHLLHGSFIETLENIWESTGITSYACRKVKGAWIGGHDPLGHVFLLIHSSLYMYLETAPYFPGFRQVRYNLNRLSGAHESMVSKIGVLWNTPLVFVGLLVALWWFMLLMTNIYFHLILEKLVGLVFGYIGIAAIYYVPRWI
ncbi:FIT family protein scs3 [Candida viswanathii]|uniref:Acyl-coenzyme A diphosphatase SCS3 n=1 Tax=Candida viswanathii TaxID=5486 RepID=A0A367XMA3_9ASCO|nr:FIT family protein scs3 [Candida viswanathii]